MKTDSGKATLSKSAEALMSTRDSARDVLKRVVESQARQQTAASTSGMLHSASGMYILTENPSKSADCQTSGEAGVSSSDERSKMVPYKPHVVEKIRRGQMDIEEGRSYTTQQARQKLSKWLVHHHQTSPEVAPAVGRPTQQL